jgi:hypothetical protein
VKNWLCSVTLALALAPALLLAACAEKEVGLSPEDVNAAIRADGSAQLPALDGIPAPHGMASEK